MKHTVSANKTLLVDGPASVFLLAGEAKVFGAPFRVGEKIVIRDGKRLAFEVLKETTFDLRLGAEGSPVEVEGSTIPPSWAEAVEKILSHEPPVTVMILGGVDSGKTSFCTLLANMALRKKRRVAVLDADLGQSDIGPPATIGYSRLKSFIKDLFDVEADAVSFVGLTSPSEDADLVAETLSRVKAEMSKLNADFVVVNTDGWVEGEDAARYKLSLLGKLSPTVVVGLQHSDELAALFNAFSDIEKYLLDSPSTVYKRNREKRRILRELSYKKYMKDAKVNSLPLNWVKTEGTSFGKGTFPPARRMNRIQEILEFSPFYCEEAVKQIWLVFRENQYVDQEKIQEVEEALKKKVKVIFAGEEEGLLVALKDDKDKFLGIGVVKEIDYRRHTIKISTRIKSPIAVIHFGKIKLDSNFREIGAFNAFES